jgi:hypothetical protein
MNGRMWLRRVARIVVKMSVGLSVVPVVISPSRAGVVGCSTTVSSVSVSPGGNVTVGLSGFGFAYMCNVLIPHPTSVGNIPIDVCKAWLAQFMTAQAQGKRVEFIVDYGAAAAPSCSAITGWNWAVPNPFPYYLSFPSN